MLWWPDDPPFGTKQFSEVISTAVFMKEIRKEFINSGKVEVIDEDKTSTRDELADEAAFALGTPLTYVSGRPGNEIFVTLRQIGGGGFFPRNDPLYLQFRRGHLTGWKGFWGNRWAVVP